MKHTDIKTQEEINDMLIKDVVQLGKDFRFLRRMLLVLFLQNVILVLLLLPVSK